MAKQKSFTALQGGVDRLGVHTMHYAPAVYGVHHRGGGQLTAEEYLRVDRIRTEETKKFINEVYESGKNAASQQVGDMMHLRRRHPAACRKGEKQGITKKQNVSSKTKRKPRMNLPKVKMLQVSKCGSDLSPVMMLQTASDVATTAATCCAGLVPAWQGKPGSCDIYNLAQVSSKHQYKTVVSNFQERLKIRQQ